MNVRKSKVYRGDDDLSGYLRKLKDPIFVDYLLYRTGHINNYSPLVNSTSSIHQLKKELLHAIATNPSKHFMENYNPRDQSPQSLDKWVRIHYNDFEKHCLTETNYAWLDKRATRINYFFWRLIEHLEPITNPHGGNGDNIIHHEFKLTTSMSAFNLKKAVGIPSDKTSVGITRNDIIFVVNRLRNNKPEKEKLVKRLYEYSQHATSNNEVTRWFENNEKNKTSWMCDYLDRNGLEYRPLALNGSSAHTDDIISFFDVLSVVNIDKYKLLVANFKKAWNQKTYREKNQEKKQYSINMSKDIGDLLDKLSYIENKNKNDIIEALIRRAYAETFLL